MSATSPSRRLRSPRPTLLQLAEQDLIACRAELQTWHWNRTRSVELVTLLEDAIAECRRIGTDDVLYATYHTIHPLIQGWFREAEFQRIFGTTMRKLDAQQVTRHTSEAERIATQFQTLQSDMQALRREQVALGLENQQVQIAHAAVTKSHSDLVEAKTALEATKVSLQAIIKEKDEFLALTQQKLAECQAEKASLKEQLTKEQEKNRILENENARLQRLLGEKTPPSPDFYDSPFHIAPPTESRTENFTEQRTESFIPSHTLRATR